MSSSLPSFQLASELPPSPTREQVLEDKIREQATQLERLQDDGPQKKATGIKPDELQKLIILFNTFDGRIKELEQLTEKQAKLIEDMKNVNYRSEEAVIAVKGLAKDRIGELIAEIVDIRAARKLDNERVNDHAEWLTDLEKKVNDHADAINRVWQATKKTQTPPTGKKSKARIERMKEILRNGPKSYKELERLLEISPKEMNRLVSRLDSRSYEIFFRAGDNRQKVLRLRAWNSLTSNVKDFDKEGNTMG
jgi:uncharacterized protein YoxC